MNSTFSIIADGADITALINDRLLLLRTTDKPRMGSDDFELAYTATTAASLCQKVVTTSGLGATVAAAWSQRG